MANKRAVDSQTEDQILGLRLKRQKPDLSQLEEFHSAPMSQSPTSIPECSIVQHRTTTSSSTAIYDVTKHASDLNPAEFVEHVHLISLHFITSSADYWNQDMRLDGRTSFNRSLRWRECKKIHPSQTSTLPRIQVLL